MIVAAHALGDLAATLKAAARRLARRFPAWRSELLAAGLAGLVLALSLAVSHQLWDRERRDIEDELRAEFDTRVREIAALFRERMLAYEQTLNALNGLFAASPQVRSGEFHAFVDKLRIEHHPGLQGLGYIALMAGTTLGRPGAGSVARFFEPPGFAYLGIAGSDTLAEPARRHAMEAARDAAAVAISNKIRLPEEDSATAQAGYRMYLPVYARGRPQDSPLERRAAISGWIYAAFSTDGLIDSILGERTDITIEVEDGGVGRGDEQAPDSDDDRVGGESSLRLFVASRRVEVGRYSWTVTARSLPNFTSPIATGKLRLVAQLGVVASVLLAALVWLSVRRRARMLREALQLRLARDEAEAANRAKTRFLAAASHDLRQPIQALGLFVATLESLARRPRLEEGMLETVTTRMRLALSVLGRLLNGLLELSRLDSGTVAVRRQPVSVATVLGELQASFAGPAQARGLALRLRAPRALWVATDPTVLGQVLSNLVSNAIRYTERGTVLLGCRRRPGAIEIQVLDTGPGIALAERERIFEEFYRVAGASRGADGERESGFGLGLAIARRSAALLGATIRVESVPGRGSLFSLTLACSAVVPAAAAPARAGADAGTPQAGSPGVAVLIVDDDPLIRDAMGRLLREQGCAVLAAGSVAAALRLAAGPDEPPALILADYHLRGGETGVDAIVALRQALGRAVPAALVTGDTSREVASAAAAHGVAVCYKPLTSAGLADLLARMAPDGDPQPGGLQAQA